MNELKKNKKMESERKKDRMNLITVNLNKI